MANPSNNVQLQYEAHKELDLATEVSQDEAAKRARHLCQWIKRTGLPADSFLDAGCRNGLAMEEFSAQFPAARVVGIDIVPEFVESAALRGEAIVGDIQDIPYNNSEFDWVFSSHCIEHCPDSKKAAAELFRVAKVGCMVYTDLEDDTTFKSHPFHFTRHNDPIEWVDLFRHPEFWLMKLNVPRFTRIDTLWVRKAQVEKYNANYNIPVLEKL